MSAWVRRVGWRIGIANGTANLRRSPRVNGGKEKPEQISARKGKGRGNRSKKDGKIRHGFDKEDEDRIDRGTYVVSPRTSENE